MRNKESMRGQFYKEELVIHRLMCPMSVTLLTSCFTESK